MRRGRPRPPPHLRGGRGPGVPRGVGRGGRAQTRSASWGGRGLVATLRLVGRLRLPCPPRLPPHVRAGRRVAVHRTQPESAPALPGAASLSRNSPRGPPPLCPATASPWPPLPWDSVRASLGPADRQRLAGCFAERGRSGLLQTGGFGGRPWRQGAVLAASYRGCGSSACTAHDGDPPSSPDSGGHRGPGFPTVRHGVHGLPCGGRVARPSLPSGRGRRGQQGVGPAPAPGAETCAVRSPPRGGRAASPSGRLLQPSFLPAWMCGCSGRDPVSRTGRNVRKPARRPGQDPLSGGGLPSGLAGGSPWHPTGVPTRVPRNPGRARSRLGWGSRLSSHRPGA